MAVTMAGTPQLYFTLTRTGTAGTGQTAQPANSSDEAPQPTSVEGTDRSNGTIILRYRP